MSPWLLSIPYPPSQGGFWDPVTSTINWCEEDYYATIYAAELVNTVTNVLFIWLAIKGIFSCRKNGHDDIFLVTFVGYMVVGIGSFLFHMTLKYPMQLVDELSMIYTTCFMCYATFSFATSRRFSIILGVSLVSLAVFITLYYHYLQDPSFHQNAFTILIASVPLRGTYLMETRLRPSLKKLGEKYKPDTKKSMTAERKSVLRFEDRRDEEILSRMWLLIGCGVSIFLLGFGIWALDNTQCSTLRRWRREIGLPWGILLEGHGWWHLMTGTGAYIQIVWGIWLRHCLDGRQDEYELDWPRIFSIPDVIKKSSANDRGKGNLNGSAKLDTQKQA